MNKKAEFPLRYLIIIIIIILLAIFLFPIVSDAASSILKI